MQVMSVALMLCVCVTPALCLMYVEQSARTNAIAAPPVRLRCSYIFASKSDSLGRLEGDSKRTLDPNSLLAFTHEAHADLFLGSCVR